MQGVARNDGYDLPFVVEGDGAAGTLIFAHGLTGSGAHTRLGNGALVDAGWRCISFDQRGHADATPVVDPAGYDPMAMGSDLWAVLDEVGVEKCWIGGGSMGAATSFCSAKLQPNRVEGLISGCPALTSEPHELIFVFDAFGDALRDGGIEQLITQQKELLAQLGVPQESIDRVDDLRVHDPKSLELAVRHVPKWLFPDIPSAYATFPFPVVVIGWPDDPIHPVAVAQLVADAVPTELITLDFQEVQSDQALIGRVMLDAIGATAVA